MSDSGPASALSRPSSSLAGATLVVTRPVGQGAGLARRARALGARTVLLPGLTLRPSADADTARALLAAPFDGWIFVSPQAARFTFALAPDWRLPAGARAFGVGEGTRRALARQGVASFAPRSSSDSEGLLALPELAAVEGQRFALVKAPGGRGLLAATLVERGAELVPIHVYERHAPRLTRRHFEALAAAPALLLTLLSSAVALEHLLALLPPAQLARLREGSLIASSARLAALAAERGFGDVLQATSALPADLLQGAAQALARHRL